MRFVRDRASVSAAAAVAAASLFSFASRDAQAAVFVPTTGTVAWNVDANWSSPATFPNASGAVADFGTRTGTSTVNLTEAITVGSISYLNNANFTLNLTNGGGGLTLNNGGAGATITDDGTSTSLWTISATTALADNLTVHTANANSTSAAGEITFTGTVSGTGFGVTKTGPGLVTFGTANKTYTGATTVQGGRLRVSTAGRPTATSGVSIGTGAQLFLLDAASYTFGSSSATPITVNGIGTIPSSSTGGTQLGGSFGAAGAIRQGTAGTTTVVNDIVVGSNDGSVSAGNTNTNVLILSGVISGSNRLRVNPFGNAPDQGTVRVTNTNTYSGGTLISQGVLQVSGANATLGTGDVYVDGASNDLIGDGTPASTAGLASGRLTIDAGVLNAIADTATLTLTGDTATFGGPDGTVGGIATLGSGIDELVAALILGGVSQVSDFDGVTFGSTASAADVKNDAYFSTLGTGVIRLAAIPEPTSLAMLGLGGLGLLRRRRA